MVAFKWARILKWAPAPKDLLHQLVGFCVFEKNQKTI